MRKKRVKPTNCFRCGRATIYPTKEDNPYNREPHLCFWCGANQFDAAWFSRLVQSDVVLRLRCPYINVHGPKDDRGLCLRCEYTREIAMRNLAPYRCYGGNGPNTYAINAYHEVQFRCPTCEHWVDGETLMTNNWAAMKTAGVALEAGL